MVGRTMTVQQTTGGAEAATRSRGAPGRTMTGSAGAARAGGGQGRTIAGAAGAQSTRTAGGNYRLHHLAQLTGLSKPNVLISSPQTCPPGSGTRSLVEVLWQSTVTALAFQAVTSGWSGGHSHGILMQACQERQGSQDRLWRGAS